MSFSTRVKEELAGHISSSRHCRLAELAAIVMLTGTSHKDFVPEETERAIALKKAKKLQAKLEISKENESYYQALKIKQDENGRLVDRMLVERVCCKQAFVRGAFLAAGSVTNPEKGYHFEIVCETEKQAELLLALIRDFGMEPRMVQRKRYYVVYLKDGSMIVDILKVMGAYISLMDMENVRILKEISNDVNRRVNCETANLNKTVSAAVKQIEDIQYIEAQKGLMYLPENLREIARIRLEDTDLSLKEIGEMLEPPLGKSGVNHRLRKISEIANELRRKES